MQNFKPEGQTILTPSNQAALSSPNSLHEACIVGDTLEARALLCDKEHNLRVDLGCMYGIIPHNEGALGIDNGSVLDVIEIDAASNNGVDNIRDLRDEANFTPVKAKYRVYIIDEVHMLSTGAFNALLKILEEPPEHVIFILATTEVHKLPATILSRCQRFDFKRITPEDICARLQYVAEHENITLDELKETWMAKMNDNCVFISAKERINIEELKNMLYEKAKQIHMERFPYNDFLFQKYDDLQDDQQQ